MEQQLEFLSLQGDCTGFSVSTLVKMLNCWKSHVAAQIYVPVDIEVAKDAVVASVGVVVVEGLGVDVIVVGACVVEVVEVVLCVVDDELVDVDVGVEVDVDVDDEVDVEVDVAVVGVVEVVVLSVVDVAVVVDDDAGVVVVVDVDDVVVVSK